MGCGCNKGKQANAATLKWQVNLAGTGKQFEDGTTSKTYALASEAATAIAKLGLTGKVRPRPTRT